jgi:signal transduction histidine kinase
MRMVRVQVAEVSQETSSKSFDDELRLLGRMAAGVVHDLNNYLGAIHATLTLLAHAPAERDLLPRALDCVDQAGRLTSTLLDYVRGAEPAFQPVDFGSLVRRTLALFERALPSDIEIQVEIAEGLSPVHGVPAELEQLVLNLVLNAADAMPDGGDLVVRVLPTEGSAVYFEISDTGKGIAIAPLETIDATTPSTKAGRRIGLGLGIVQRVVDHHAGAVAISARRDSSGTTAIIFLPVA